MFVQLLLCLVPQLVQCLFEVRLAGGVFESIPGQSLGYDLGFSQSS